MQPALRTALPSRVPSAWLAALVFCAGCGASDGASGSGPDGGSGASDGATSGRRDGGGAGSGVSDAGDAAGGGGGGGGGTRDAGGGGTRDAGSSGTDDGGSRGGGTDAGPGDADAGGGSRDGGGDAGLPHTDGGDAHDGGATGPDGGGGPDDPDFLAAYPIEALHTEGGIYDPVDHVFYVGSLSDGSVRRIDAATGEETVLFRETAPGVWWTLGMDVDVERRRLHVCAMDDRREVTRETPPYDGYVWTFDLDTGERVRNRKLDDIAPTATCTDVAVAADGTVYICDRENPRIYELTTRNVLSVLVEHDDLAASIVGQNALLVLPDQSALLSLIYLPSRLVHVRLSDGHTTDIQISGDFFDGFPALSGADGMAWDGESVLVAFTSQLNRLTPTAADWSRARSVSVDVPSGITDIVATPVGHYLLNGQAVGFALGSTPEPSKLVWFDDRF